MKLYTVHIHFRDDVAKLGTVDARETEKLYILDDYHFEKGFNKTRYQKKHLAADAVATTPEDAIKLFLGKIDSKINYHKKSVKLFKRKRMAVEFLIERNQ